MLMPAWASGAAMEARTPVSPKSSGPSTLNMRQPATCFTPAGTRLSAQTMDSSSLVRVMEPKPALPEAQAGIGAPAASWQTARCSLLRDRFMGSAFLRQPHGGNEQGQADAKPGHIGGLAEEDQRAGDRKR